MGINLPFTKDLCEIIDYKFIDPKSYIFVDPSAWYYGCEGFDNGIDYEGTMVLNKDW